MNSFLEKKIFSKIISFFLTAKNSFILIWVSFRLCKWQSAPAIVFTATGMQWELLSEAEIKILQTWRTHALTIETIKKNLIKLSFETYFKNAIFL